MTLKNDLIAAKALINAPEKWIRREFSDDQGKCFCTLGAAFMARRGDPCLWADDIEAALEKSLPAGFESNGKGRPVAQFNDHPDTTHADIMALFDRAIEAAS